jgi:hypothetical protein
MGRDTKTKASIGTVAIDNFSPQRTDAWPPAINVTVSFEEALKLHLGLGQILGKLNSYSRSTKAGRDAGVNLCVFTTGTPQITINEARVKSAKN